VANNPERLGNAQRTKWFGLEFKVLRGANAHAKRNLSPANSSAFLNEDSSQTCAVEYRTNFQSRAFEEVFRRRGLRYKLWAFQLLQSRRK